LRQKKMTQLFDAFISYGRADSKAFAQKLQAHLNEAGFKVWFDFNDIPLAVDFQNQIDDGIEKASYFLFIISPHSVNSPYCLKEIELAVKLNKRIIPLLHVMEISQETWQQRNPNGTEEEWQAYKAKGLHESYPNMHPTIRKLNWVYFQDGINDFEQSLADLINLLDSHRDYVDKHTQFLVKALEWKQQHEHPSILLRGSELAVAEAWLQETQGQKKQPAATELQQAYIQKSKGYKHKNRLVLIGAVVSVMGIMTTAAVASTTLWLKAEWQEVREKTVSQVQSNLRDASADAREPHLIKGHEDGVFSVAFSPDGNRIVSGSGDKTIRLWDTSGNLIGQPFQGHEGWVLSVAFSPDGNRIVSGGYDNTIRLWDTSGNLIGQPFQGHESLVSSVAFSPDGNRIVSGSFDDTIRLWDTSGNLIGQPFQGHERSVTSVAFSPDGKYIVSGSFDHTIRLWDTSGNLIGQPFQGHEDSVTSVAFSPDGKYIVSGSGDNTIRLWDTSGNLIGQPFKQQPFKGLEYPVRSVAFSPDGNRIVSGSLDGMIRLWDTSGNLSGQPFQGHEDSSYAGGD
jgi:WD40 repeat protein